MTNEKIPTASGHVYLGCSGWAYPSWRPEFYPAGSPAKKLLELYAGRLNSVEVNYTFRTLPTLAVVQGWLRQTGEGFRFSLKAPERITHRQRLLDCGAAMEEFVASIEPVQAAGRTGAVLFQLPPNMKIDLQRLAGFLKEITRFRLRVAFEFRHASWFEAEVYRLLEKFEAALCVAESDDLETSDVETAPFSFYRLRKSEYSEERLAAVAALLQQRAGKGDVFAYFRHEEAPTGALRAVRVRGLLREQE